jgi:hypothetical protein
MSSTPLLDWTPAHQKHSATSRAAAEAIKPRVGPMHAKILGLLGTADGRYCGATDEEMQRVLAMFANTQRPRRRELQLWGYITDSGRTRLTKSGRAAVVWVLAPPQTASHPDERAERAT